MSLVVWKVVGEECTSRPACGCTPLPDV